MNTLITVLVVGIGILIGFLILGILFHKKSLAAAFEISQAEARKVLEDARKEADSVVRSAMKDAKEEAKKRRRAFEEEAKKRRTEVAKLEKKLKSREQSLENKISSLAEREQKADDFYQRLQKQEQKHLSLRAEYELAIENTQKELKKVAKLSTEEARAQLLRSLEDEVRKESRDELARIEEETRKEAQVKATEILCLSVQKLASEHVNDSLISVVSLPSEDMKGRIIGREGRNIRAIEQATGVDLIVDDTPEAVIISSFNPIRREIAKITLENLISDGRIHPARITETVKRVETEFQTTIREAGEQAAFDVGITDLHPTLIEGLGKLKFRSSGNQSLLAHSVETARICGIMADEMKLNSRRAKRAGLLHDIGKSVDHDTEGHHAEVGANLCKKVNEHEEVVTAVRLHQNDDLTNASPLTVIINAANHLSRSRPGARKEAMETYIRRLEDMETVVNDFEKVDSAFVMQAGREVRALVTSEHLEDTEVRTLSHEVAAKIRQELTFPGQVRVCIVRESTYVDFAR
ncbi:MAG: ribonuclease Y [Oligoflexales bacterium]